MSPWYTCESQGFGLRAFRGLGDSGSCFGVWGLGWAGGNPLNDLVHVVFPGRGQPDPLARGQASPLTPS